MFDLEREVQAWCARIHRGGRDRGERMAELADHLYCQIDRLLAEGHDEEEAFRIATSRMGEPADLAREHAKNLTGWPKARAILFALCTCRARALDDLLTDKARARWIIGVSLFFAGAMLVSSWLMRGMEMGQTGTYVLLAIWWVPYSVLLAASPCRERSENEESSAAR